nr:ATP synthase F0 subunit B [Pseudomonadota bacterium]
SVYDQITGKLDLGFQDIGEQALKNISRPIRVYRVSGTGVPQRPTPPVPRARRMSKSLRWGIGAAVVVAMAGIAAWQTGWVRFSATDRGNATNAVAPVAPPAAAPAAALPAPSGVASGAPAIASATPSQTDAETQRLRADAEALKKQAGAELARARTDAEAVRAARTKADGEAAANRVRAQAEADAARIRSEAEAAATRAKGDAETAARDAEARVAKVARVPASAVPGGTRYDGAWGVTVVCAPSEGGASYKLEFDAQVKDSFFRGEQGVEAKPGWLRLQGAIQPDGSATLDAKGTTGDPKFNVKGGAQGQPYAYHVAANFDPNRGTGRRLELRPCDLRFEKK